MNANHIFTLGKNACRKSPSQTGRARGARSLALLTAAGVTLVSTALADPVAAQVATPAAGNNWTTPAGTVEGTRYSSLAQINTTNVARLTQEFEFETGIEAGHEGAPLVVGNTMYMVSPFPNKLFALDVANRGQVKWVFDPKADPFAQGKACCDIVNRGAVYADGKIIYNVLDTTTVAVNAITGKEVWRRKLGNVRIGETMTMAPLVVGNKVFVGNSGGEMGVRGFIAALNVSNGQLAWKAFSTGPDVDVKIGPNFNPFYAKDDGTNLGVTSWPANTRLWELGGSTVWGWITYDPQLNLIFHGTANPGVWNHTVRPGDNKWSTTLFARRPATGEAVWAYQITPHDTLDHDGVNENIVVDLPVSGALRKLLVRFDRNGFAYTQDRVTGQVLHAKPFVFVNWAERIDLATGEPVVIEAKVPIEGVVVPDICPAPSGGKDQQPAAFSPRTSLFYVPSNNLCQDFEALKVVYIEGTPFVGASVEMKAGPGGNRGEFFAWDAVTGTKKWGIKERFPVWSGVLATAGDVVFYGTMDKWFKAVDARTGRVLFRKQLDSGIVGHPMTFMGADGKQRVAVYSGVGGWAGAIVPAEFSVEDPFAALGFVGAMTDLPDATGPGGTVHVFKLN